MLKRKAALASYLAIFFVITPLFVGCNDEPATLGVEILPSDDLFEANTLAKSPAVMNVWTDGIQSDGPTEASYAILGYFNDPRFGSTKADFVTEVSLVTPREAFKENDNFVVDSLILTLSYARRSWVGDSLATHKVKVYELSERLPYTGKFYSNTSMDGKYYPDPIGEKEWSAYDGVPDSVWTTSGYVHTTKIFLNEAFSNKILNLSSKDLAHRDSLKDAMNGFYITLDDPANPGMFNSLLKINLLASTSELTLYYHKNLIDAVTGESYGQENFTYTFPINREARMFNRFTHQHGDKIEFNTTNSPYLYIQNMSGSYASFDFSDEILAWKDSSLWYPGKEEQANPEYSISSVELIFEVDTFTKEHASLYMPQLTELYVYEKDETGKFVIPRFENRYGTNQSAFIRNGAAYNIATNQFVFKMDPDYFVKVAMGEIEPRPFYLRGTNPEFNLSRTVLINEAFPDKKPRLNIKYVKYK